jgi:bifunctional isochorismate lyase/aryl carrier protein
LAGSKAEDRAEQVMKQLRPYLSSHRVAAERFDPDNSALLVIDMQRYFLDRSSQAYLPDSATILDNVTDLIEAYRKRSLPVLFTKHSHPRDEKPGSMARWWKDLIRDGDEMAELDDRFRPRVDEPVLSKSRYSAFVGTDLEKRLRTLNVKDIVITGVMTHLCCETTARDAFMRDFDVFVVVDGTASESEDLHVSSLKTLSDGFAMPVRTREVIGWCNRQT